MAYAGVVHRPFKWCGVDPSLEEKVWALLHASGTVASVMDIGARDSTIPTVFPGAAVALFEPNPKGYQQLLQAWGTTPRVKVCNYGIGNSHGPLLYYENTASFVKRSVHVKSHGDGAALAVKTFADAMADVSWDRVDFVKIDTEGFEYRILKSAQEYLAAGKVRYVQFEVGGTMFDAGYTLHDLFALFPSDWRFYNMENDALNRIDAPFTWDSKYWYNGNFFATAVDEATLHSIMQSPSNA